MVSALFLAVATLSCNRNNDQDLDHGHVDNLQLISYSDGFEMFAEATPFAVGHESEILAHFTRLENFKPLENGSVTASLVVGDDTVSQTLDSPMRPGIFRFTLKPGEKGEAKLLFNVKISGKISQLTVEGITVFADLNDAIHAAEDAVITSSNGAVFTKEQSWKVDFATEEIRKEPFGQVIRTIGQIQPSPGDERIVVAKTGGVVLFPGDDVVEGRAVGAGETLFTIDGSGMADNNLSVRFSEARNEYSLARAEYDRKAELAKDRIVSQRELRRAETEMENARANFNNLQKNFSAGKQSVNSPSAGLLRLSWYATESYAESRTALFLRVSQNRNLFVKAELRPKYFEELNRISTVNFRFMEKKENYKMEELNGRVVSFGKSADTGNPLLPVLFQVDNRAGFIPGSFIEMFIRTQAGEEVLTVANEAVVEEMGNYFVYVQLTPELFEKRLVKRGRTDGLRTEITTGVSEAERVVSKGAILVKLAQAAGAIDVHSGHVH